MIRKAEDILKENMPHGKLFESVAIQAIKVAQRELLELCIEISHEQGTLGYPEFIEPQLKKLLEQIK